MRIQPKKRLGQNFLIDQNIRNKIIDALELRPDDIILEIGSGKGELTGLISRKISKIYSLEIDKWLYSRLTELFKADSSIKLINQDILKFDLSAFLDSVKAKGKVKVFGNIPYYISSPIIEHLFKFRERIGEIFITVQKEFAHRIVAPPGSRDYSSFSCFTQFYSEPKIIFDISRNCFKPKPKIDSSFLKLKIRESGKVLVKDEKLFFKIIRSAFNQRRKILSNSLKGVVSQNRLRYFFEHFGIDEKVRPERLTLENFAFLANL